MDNRPLPKPGFRITLSKKDFSTGIEVLHLQKGCATARLDGLTLILLGEVLDANGFLSASEILDRFQRLGADCAKAFDGSFVLLFASDSPAPLIVVTDPLNSLKCFIEETPEAYVLVSSLCFLPARTRAADPVAIASFLANGVIYNNRTLFDGVRSLCRASIHTIDPREGHTSRPYWEYKLDNSFSKRSRKDLKKELASLLLNAARKRIKPSETIFLSLSGGYDSTCILGLLSKLAPGKVDCFSYVVNNGTLGSDEDVAAQMAKIAGCRHTSVPAFNGDIVDVIRRNATLGEGRAHFCAELDAWQSIHEKMSDDAVFFVGDECFGWTGCRLRSERDVLASVPLHLSNVLSRYADCLDTKALGEEYDREILRLTEASLDSDLHNTKDFLYLDQRLGNVIMPWRELFAGQYAPVRNLLLDRDILSFMAHLPSRFRLGKNLYKETIRMMFPELFRVRRAFKPAVDSFRIAFFEQREAIENELTCGKSLADPWIKTAQCQRLLPKTRPTETFSFKTRAILFGKKMLKESPMAHAVRNFLPPKPLASVDPVMLLIRVITLRNYLRL
jgi:asparagine synthase (glutamine-hydrolysing)